PWTLAGRTVDVRERDGHVEILAAGVPVAVHPKALLPGITIPLPQQWTGLPLGGDKRPREAVALRIPSPEVEVRSLAAYEALAEVARR
ncbi:MAG: hypothetical protein IRY92_11205, partial [Dactylosporangium sp.]|nr:hypothetical protein [Dactylosporangium sp.]